MCMKNTVLRQFSDFIINHKENIVYLFSYSNKHIICSLSNKLNKSVKNIEILQSILCILK